jgi:hypothetical protein
MPAINTRRRTGVMVNTTDATETTAATIATKSDRAYHVRGVIVAVDTADFNEVASYEVRGTFKNDNGTLSLVGSVTADHTGESTGGWAATLDASGTDIRARVTGAAATTITWLVDLDVWELGQIIAEYGPKD